MIIKEILETEKSFLSDMLVLQDVYVVPSAQSNIFSPQDHKLLFGNLDKIIQVSTDLYALMESAAKDQMMGQVFLDMLQPIEKNYCDYCKHNEACLTRLSEFCSTNGPQHIKDFLNQSRQQLQGRTGAWDLGSLIVKPVQRVLKYPLLLKTLLKETPQEHSDYTNINRALDAMEDVAETINKVKKRKDIVDKYVEGKSSLNVMHGISKKWNRGAQRLKRNIGLADEEPEDLLYEEYAQRFDVFFNALQSLNKDMLQWIKCLKTQFECEDIFSGSLLQTFIIEKPPLSYQDTVSLLHQYKSACTRLITGPWKTAESQMKDKIVPGLETCVSMFKVPQLLMKKRESKLLDYERVKEMRLKNEQIDKALLDSADQFESINEQLTEDLPKFLGLVSEYVHCYLLQAVEIQTNLYNNVWQGLALLLESLHINPNSTTDEITTQYLRQMQTGSPAELHCRSAQLLQRWHQQTWIDQDFQPWNGNARQSNADTLRTSRSNSQSLIDASGGKMAPRPITGGDVEIKLRSAVLHDQILQPIRLYEMPKVDPSYAVQPFTVVAMYDFQAELADEMSFKEHQEVQVIFIGGREGCEPDAWWYGRSNNQQGWFPASYTQ
ncbi:Dbl homology domain-containing protein [Gorgonomyces haynaldii]|nr:Dbl homology domain-containing protein [Gorgonomyces haynaldii]